MNHSEDRDTEAKIVPSEVEAKPKAKARPKGKSKSAAKSEAKPETPEKKIRKVRNPLEHAEYFGKQYTKTSDLPDPGDMLKVLATGIVQVLAGERQVDQLAKYVTEDLYLQLRDAALHNIRKRAAAGKPKNRLQIEVRRVQLGSPRDGVIESVVLLNSDSRTRAVAIRLEGLNARWQATMVNVL